MATLTFLDWNKETTEREFVGWAQSGHALFVLDPDDRRSCFQLDLPKLHDNERKLIWKPAHLPVSLTPVSITRCRLIPPPVDHPQDPGWQGAIQWFEPWRTVYGETLPGDLSPTQIHAEWASANGFDLAEMHRDRALFLKRLPEWADNAIHNIHGASSTRQEVALKLNPDDHDYLLAQIRYRIDFADGSRRWVAAVHQRELQGAEESLEFDALLAAHKPLLLDLVPVDDALMELGKARKPKQKPTEPISRKTLRNYCKPHGFDPDNLTRDQLEVLKGDARKQRADEKVRGMKSAKSLGKSRLPDAKFRRSKKNS